LTCTRREPAGGGNVSQGSPWIKQDALGDLGDIAVDEKIQRKVSSNERRRPPIGLKRLVAGVSGYICDECVTKCVAVLKQHGGFPPTFPSR
jgi:hypothetical protein